MVQYLIEYANKNSMILELNEKDICYVNPFLAACNTGYSNMVQLLIDYFNKNNLLVNRMT